MHLDFQILEILALLVSYYCKCDALMMLTVSCQMMGSLEEVHVPQNGINYKGVMALASAMEHNPELRVLNLNDNTFTKKGTLAMAQVRSIYFQVLSVS